MKSNSIFLLISMLMFLHASSQTTYYLATTSRGGNDANSGKSLSDPLATLTAAISKVIAGDTIYVRSGTYEVASTIRLNKAGTAERHIVLSAFKPDVENSDSRPIFDFSAMIYSSSNRGFLLSAANYWDIYGLVIKGAGDNGMNVGGTGFTTITFCSFTRNRDTGLQLGGASHHITITNCDSYENADLGPGSTSAGGNADGFAPKLDVGDSIWFRGCRAWLNSDDGWDGYLRPSNNVNAILEDCWSFRNGYYWLDNSTTSSQNGNGFKLGGSDTKDLAYNFTLVNCLSFDNKANGFDQNSNAGAIKLYNCSAYRNSGRDYFMTSGTVTYQPGAALVIRNCISLGTRGVSLPATSTALRPYTASNNLFSTSVTNAEILSTDTAGVSASRNIDGSLRVIDFMRLNSAAPRPYKYIDAGTVLSDVIYHGALGVPYVGVAPDLGAFESSLAVLPVGLISISAYAEKNDIVLEWKTASEKNNKGWFIEQAVAALSAWKSIGFVNGRNESSDQNDYSYRDRDLVAGRYLYRLRQVDLDGHTGVSKVISAEVMNARKHAAIWVYPNPVRSSATVRYTIASKARVTVALFNKQGQLVNTLVSEEQQQGNYERKINAGLLAAGSYFLQLKVGNETMSLGFTKY